MPTRALGTDQQGDKHEMTVTAVVVGTNLFAFWPCFCLGLVARGSVMTGGGKAHWIKGKGWKCSNSNRDLPEMKSQPNLRTSRPFSR